MELWALAAGAGLGAGFGVLGTFVARVLTDRLIEARGLRGAIAAEIRAVLSLIQRDALIFALDEQIGAMERSEKMEPFRVSFRSTYSIVFTANASKLNLLPRWRRWFSPSCKELVSNLVEYYYQLQTTIELAEMIASLDGTLETGRPPLGIHVPPRGRLGLCKRLRKVTEEMQTLGQDLVNCLEGLT